LFVGVPLKYIGNDVTLVKMLGMPHGFLFMAYIAFIIVLRFDNPWFKKHFILIALASVFPLGTFVVEQKLRKTIS
jgi:integral membrane protein